MEYVTRPAAVLRNLCREALAAAGAPEPHARMVSDSLVDANLRGLDSHGLQMLLPYLEQIGAGSMDPRASGSVVSENGSCATWDGNNGMGQVIADRCTDLLIRLASVHGLALVAARNSNHFGAAAYWARKAARAGYIGIVTSNASPAVPPWQGIEPRVGTNPIAMAVPSDAWVLDMATTTVALGKLHDAAWQGRATVPAGWAMDGEGRPTTDTQAALRGFMMPLGGYKGSGLALLAEILAAGLSGGPMSIRVGSLRHGYEPLRISHMFLAIDPERFTGLAEFNDSVGELMENVRSSAPAPGYDEVLAAGDPEQRLEQQRLRDGIPVPMALWKKLSTLADRTPQGD